MTAFWSNGFEATSMAELVAATGATRQSIYGDFGGKRQLYYACFDLYRFKVVEPALAPFRADRPGLSAIAAYFETQISLAEAVGLPGPGCLVGNAMTELARRDADVMTLVMEHNARLERAFDLALPATLPDQRRQALAAFLVVAAQGLWALSRVTHSVAELRSRAATIVGLLEREVSHAT